MNEAKLSSSETKRLRAPSRRWSSQMGWEEVGRALVDGGLQENLICAPRIFKCVEQCRKWTVPIIKAESEQSHEVKKRRNEQPWGRWGTEEEIADEEASVQLQWERKWRKGETETVIDCCDSEAGGAALVNHQSCLLSKQDRRSHRSHVSKEPTQQQAAQKVSGAVKLNFNL